MTKVYLLAAIVISAATPAVAKDAKPSETSVPSEMSAPTGAPAHTASREQKYCVIETITGSRIPHKTCQTRAEWLDQGFDPLAK